jgi:hypothetical protein
MGVVQGNLGVVAADDGDGSANGAGRDRVHQGTRGTPERADDRLDGESGHHRDGLGRDADPIRVPVGIGLDRHPHDRLADVQPVLRVERDVGRAWELGLVGR